MRRFTARFDFAVLGVLFGLMPFLLALAAELHMLVAPAHWYPMRCCDEADFPSGGLSLYFYVGYRREVLMFWAVPVGLFLVIIQLRRVVKYFTLAVLVAFMGSSYVVSPSGAPALRWLVDLVSNPCPEPREQCLPD